MQIIDNDHVLARRLLAPTTFGPTTFGPTTFGPCHFWPMPLLAHATFAPMPLLGLTPTFGLHSTPHIFIFHKNKEKIKKECLFKGGLNQTPFGLNPFRTPFEEALAQFR